MKPNHRIVILFAVFVLILVASGLAYNALSKNRDFLPQRLLGTVEEEPDIIVDNEPGEAETAEPELAPDFVMYDEEGNPVSLSELFGQPIVLNFWASWCPPCKGEMPEFDEVFQEFGEEVRFVMVDMVDGSQETLEKGRAYVAAEGYTFPVYYDLDMEAAYAYQVRSIPNTYFIGADGVIVAGAKGAIDKDTLLLGIRMAVGEETIA